MKDKGAYYCEIGPLLVKLYDDNPLSRQIIDDMEAVQGIEGDEADIQLVIGDEDVHTNYTPTVFSAKGSMNFNKQEFFVDYLNEFSYTVENLFHSARINIFVNKEKRNIKKRLKSIYKRRINLEKDVILSYGLFWYVTHMSLLRKKAAFIHSGVFESEKGATIISGTGGCGKTSTLFKILENEHFQYLAEDFGIVDTEGFTHFNPKPVSVYATDMEFGQTILREYFTKFSFGDKLSWLLRRKVARINPMHKIPPRKLMNNRVGKKAKIKNVLYFIRNDQETISMSDVSPEELGERVLDASLRELKTLAELLLLMKANAPEEYEIPSFQEIRRETRQVYAKAFSQTENKIIFIPLKTKPEVLTKYLLDNGLM